MSLHPTAAALLSTWFGDDESQIGELSPRWFRKDPAFDQMLIERFGAHILPATAGTFADWEGSPEGALALVLLLDQLPRNCFRGDPRGFASDAAAREVCHRALAQGHDRMVIAPKRAFFYMPLMHSEQVADHRLALQVFEALEMSARGGPFHGLVKGNLEYQRMHTAIIHRFGRYPHRNAALGRESSAEELAFLQQPGSSF